MKTTNATAALLLHLRALVIEKPILEFHFAPPRKFAFDLAFPDLHVAVEIEGGIFGIGPKCRSCGRRAPAGHSSIERLKSDLVKYNLANARGWCVLRYTPDMIDSGEAAREVAWSLGTRRGLKLMESEGVGRVVRPMAGKRDQ